MDFKALSRTAEADVQAFASAARHRPVRHQVVSVGLPGDYRLCPRLRITSRAAASRKPARESASIQHSFDTRGLPSRAERCLRDCRHDAVRSISEGVKCSHLGIVTSERNQERSVVSRPLHGEQRSRLPRCTAHPHSSLLWNPVGPSRSKSHPTALRTGGPRQPQLPSHAIHPAAVNHA